MIDLRKPLEGVPGLLLMAVLVLFGAAAGIAVALGFTWLPMSDAVANFLGGVVGAGLGAALAVLGAVYVQRLERKASLTEPLNALIFRLEELRVKLLFLRLELEKPWHTEGVTLALANQVSEAGKAVRGFPLALELPHNINKRIEGMKITAFYFEWIFSDLHGKPDSTGVVDPPEVRHQRSLAALDGVFKPVESLLADVRKELA